LFYLLQNTEPKRKRAVELCNKAGGRITMIRFNYMGLEFQQHPQGVDVFATGELQFYDSQKFMKTVPEEAKGKGRNVTLDMGELKFIDSAGLGAVLYVSEALRMQGQKLILRNVNQYNRRVLEKIAPVGTFDIQD